MEQTDEAFLVETNPADESSWVEYPVTGSFVIDIADRTELSGPLSLCIEHVVRTHVTDVLKTVAQQDARFCGKLIPSGSFYEGTKVRTPNEFDYMYELSCFPWESVKPNHVLPPIYRPTQEETPHRGYFTLEVPRTADSASTLASDDTPEVLDADVYFRAFYESLEKIARRQNQHSSKDTMMSMVSVKRNGPAVTLSFTLNKTVVLESRKCPQTSHSPDLVVALSAVKPKEVRNFNSSIKVDIVLAIPRLMTDLKLDEGHIETMFDEEDETEILHLVPSGNCWKLSVAKHESRLIRRLIGVNWRPHETIIDGGEHCISEEPCVSLIQSEEGTSSNETRPLFVEMEAYGSGFESTHGQALCVRNGAQICRRSCLLALKNLRDEQESRDLMKKAILPTYPLKVAFLQECREYPSDSDWMKDQLGRRVYGILDRVDTQSRDGSLTGCFLPNVPVLKSQSYNMSKQVGSVKRKLGREFSNYRISSGFSIAGCLLGLFFVGLFLYSSISSAIYICCSQTALSQTFRNALGKRCVFFNVSNPCSRVHVPDYYIERSQIYPIVLICFLFRWIWYIAVFPCRVVSLVCRFKWVCRFQMNYACIPIYFQCLPFMTSVVEIMLIIIIRCKTVEGGLLIRAAFEAVYMFYETTSLILICILRKRKRSINECVGPCRKCPTQCAKKPTEPYFVYISKHL